MRANAIHTVAGIGMGLCLFCANRTCAQKNEYPGDSITVVPSSKYEKSFVHDFLWGKHYREEWNTPARFKIFYLDTAKGGLTPYQSVGSRQTRSLRLWDPDKREYVLRSVDKSFSGALPEIYHNTFAEKIINDQVSVGHPYAAITIPPMAEAAGIYHTWPQNVFVPKQNALDTFNEKYGNKLYLFEQRPDENWEDAPNFGNSKNIISTDKLFEKMHQDNKHLVDQEMFVKARLFDMFIGDWGRHEDQWRWASFKSEDLTYYKPVPRDRDQTYTKFDGILLKVAKSTVGLSHQQSFAPTIKNIHTYNFAARNLDRVMTNRMSMQQWINAAKELLNVLTDSVISYSVRRMPAEAFEISGNEIIKNLKSRRDHLLEFAIDYYKFLAKEVDVTGSDKNEYFEITDDHNGGVQLTVYDLNKEGKQTRILYQRSFAKNETQELRVYGWSGKDIYDINLLENTKIKIRVIGGPEDDEYKINSEDNVNIYDSEDEDIAKSKPTKLHLSDDSAIHDYKYEGFKYNKHGFSPALYYSKQHIVYIGVSYTNTQYKWRHEPYASTQQVYLHYSPAQNAIRMGYDGVFTKFVGNWNLVLSASHDWVKVINFYGLGNETKQVSNDRNFYRIRTESGQLAVGLSHAIGKQGSITMAPFFQTVKLLNDEDRFLMKDYLQGSYPSDYFDLKKFAGLGAALKLQKLNDLVLPTKGIRFTGGAAYTKNIDEPKEFYTYAGELQLYYPIFKNLIFSMKNGASYVTGEPEFYQLSSIGGRKLRGYRRERFWGNTAFYNNNELQYVRDVRSFLFNGKAGLLVFADQGRVWLDGEKSDTWHRGYGAGIILSPFNKLYLSAMFGFSKENTGTVHVDIRRTLK